MEPGKEKMGQSQSSSRVFPFIWKDFFSDLGDITIFSLKFFTLVFKPPYEWNEVLRQMFQVGYKSLFLVSTTAFIIGLVMTIHLIPTMEQYGAEAMVPNMVAVSIFREIGPVVTALVCAGKIGSAIGAEIGSMKVTEQIDAMSISGVDPYKYLVVTRVFSTTITIPVLTVYAGAIALIGSFIAVNLEGQMTTSLFISTAFDFMYFYDVIPSIVKSILFGFTIGIIGCYYGYNATRGTAGVGKAAHTSVVSASLLIFFIDMLVAQVTVVIYD